MYRYKFSEGLTVEGAKTTIIHVAATMGYEFDSTKLELMHGYYYSQSSKSCLKIADMHEFHLRNALCSEYRKWLSEHAKKREMKLGLWLADMNEIIFSNEGVIADLWQELLNRNEAAILANP